jgi:hypothetical protein
VLCVGPVNLGVFGDVHSQQVVVEAERALHLSNDDRCMGDAQERAHFSRSLSPTNHELSKTEDTEIGSLFTIYMSASRQPRGEQRGRGAARVRQ